MTGRLRRCHILGGRKRRRGDKVPLVGERRVFRGRHRLPCNFWRSNRSSDMVLNWGVLWTSRTRARLEVWCSRLGHDSFRRLNTLGLLGRPPSLACARPLLGRLDSHRGRNFLGFPRNLGLSSSGFHGLLNRSLLHLLLGRPATLSRRLRACSTGNTAQRSAAERCSAERLPNHRTGTPETDFGVCELVRLVSLSSHAWLLLVDRCRSRLTLLGGLWIWLQLCRSPATPLFGDFQRL